LTRVELRLFGELRSYVKDLRLGEAYFIEVEGNYTIDDLMQNLEIPSEIVKIILVNGRSCDVSYRLKDNDRLALFPPIAGG
jgi:molybdopterin converting factor small subunit